jgi:hypothetical protein
LYGVSSSPGSPFLWVLSFGEAKERTSPPLDSGMQNSTAQRFIKPSTKGWPHPSLQAVTTSTKQITATMQP